MFLGIFIVTLLLLFLYVLWKMHFALGYDAVKRLDGPPLWPVIGLLHHVLTTDNLGVTKLLLEWQKVYRSPAKMKLLGTYTIELYKARNLEELVKSKTNIRKSFGYDLLRCWMGNGLLTSSGNEWHRQRKLLTPAFHFQILQDHLPVINQHANTLVEKLRKMANSAPDRTLDVCAPITLAALDLICEAAMGKQLGALDAAESAYERALMRFSDYIMYRVMRPWCYIDWFFFRFSSVGRQMKADVDLMQNFTREVIEQREESSSKTENNSMEKEPKRRLAFLDLLIDLKRQGQMTAEEVREQVDTFMFEGHDTTATAMQWACYCIGRHPEIQERICVEQNEIFNDDKQIMPTKADLKKMDLLERSIKESQRLYPSVPVIGRTLDAPLDIDGVTTLVKGMQTEIHLASLHRDPDEFPDPEKFDPDRFLPDNTAKRHPLSFIPFSAGPRNCIGQKFAMMEMMVIMSTLVRHFVLESVQEPEEMDPIYNMVFRPTNGVFIKFTARK